MISSDVLRGYNDLMILALLCEGDSYGYEIIREIDRRSGGVYQMKETTLYSAVSRLQKSGFLTSYYGSETFGKRRTYFQVTPAGRTYYRDKCREWRLTQELVNRFITAEDKEMRYEQSQ